MKSKISSEQREIIKKRILKGESYSSIAREYSVTISTIGIMGLMMGLVRKQNRKKKWTSSLIDATLIKMGSTVRRADTNLGNCKIPMNWKCTLCNHEWTTAWEHIERRILTKPHGCQECGLDSYTVYHDFLNELNPHSVYFLGAFYARGVLPKSRYLKLKKRIRLLHKDKVVLENIKCLISSNHPITQVNRNSKTSYCLQFKSSKMASKIIEYRINNRKKFPSVITPKLFPHFLRGYFDFAGYFENFEGRNYDMQSARVNIHACEEFTKKIQEEYMKINHNADGYITQKEKEKKYNVAEFHVIGLESVYKFADWIYNTQALPVKYVSGKKYNFYIHLKQKFLGGVERRNTISNNAVKMKELQGELNNRTFKKIAQRHKISPEAVSRLCRNENYSFNGYGFTPKQIQEMAAKIKEELRCRKELRRQLRETQTKLEVATGISRPSSHYLEDNKNAQNPSRNN